MRKPRKDSALKLLPEERQEQIIAWINTKKDADCPGGTAWAREQLAADGIKTSETALRDFYHWWNTREWFRRADTLAEQQEELMRDFDPGDADRARKWGEYTFLQLANAEQDPKIFTAAVLAADSRRQLDLKEKTEPRKLDIAERRVRVLEQKFAEGRATVEATDLSPEAKVAKMREIFGIA